MSRFLNDVSTLQSSEQSTMLQFRLDEALKTITAERRYEFFFKNTHKKFLIFKTFLTFSSDKDMLQKEIETLNTQIINLDTKLTPNKQ